MTNAPLTLEELRVAVAGGDIDTVVLALVVELPLAALCLWIAWHSDRVVGRRLRRLAQRAELASARSPGDGPAPRAALPRSRRRP